MGVRLRNFVRRHLRTEPAIDEKSRPYFRDMPWLKQLLPLGCRVSYWNKVSVKNDDALLWKTVVFDGPYDPSLVYFVDVNGEVLGRQLSPVIKWNSWEPARSSTLTSWMSPDLLGRLRYAIWVKRSLFDVSMLIYRFPRTTAAAAYLERLLLEKLTERQQQDVETARKRQEQIDAAEAEVQELLKD